jgi:glutamate N-acetyltransferase / amino-acid N-acetyltransferase
MPVNLPFVQTHELLPIQGVKLSYAMAHIRKPNRKDMLLMLLDENTHVSGVFTLNKFCAAPVHVCRKHLQHIYSLQQSENIRALIINTGNANAGTGESGMQHALATCQSVAEIFNIQTQQVLPFSTGVILEPLPIDRIIQGIQSIHQKIQENNVATWLDAAEAIMTTDTQPKAYSKKIMLNNEAVHITGISKGAGMIKPNMATMLGFIATDANIAQNILDDMLQDICKHSFNCITIDGDTSTNDSFILIASNKCKNHCINTLEAEGYTQIKQAILEVAQYLAQAIVRDGEGATKFIRIDVEHTHTEEDAKKIAYAIAHSPLVKTAFFASDPNLGRILAAVGYAGVEIDIQNLQMWLNNVRVIQNGSRYMNYTEAQGQDIMKNSEITIRIDLNQGNKNASVWTCDLSHDYVSINADYRS